jgi:hypothetical protein
VARRPALTAYLGPVCIGFINYFNKV